MSQKKMRSRIEQATDMLRQGMLSGRWRGTLPGRLRLAEQLDCSHGTVEVALSILAKEGWLISQVRPRRYVKSSESGFWPTIIYRYYRIRRK